MGPPVRAEGSGASLTSAERSHRPLGSGDVSLEALAPDQRAVVQLVLQQDRSYDELAGLLGISTDSVRQRARRGLDLLAPSDGLQPTDRGELADYLLGQQSDSRREATRS